MCGIVYILCVIGGDRQMTSFYKKIALVCCAAVMLLCSGCAGSEPAQTVATEPVIITLPPAPTEEETVPQTDPREEVEHLSAVLQAGEIYTLDYYPNLKSVDLSGSPCYDTILHYMEKHPEVDVTYTVSFGEAQVSNKDTAATLAGGTYDGALLLENLQYLPDLTSLTLQNPALTAQEVEALDAAYPELSLNYTVELLGNSYDAGTTQLDLSAMSSSQVEEVLPRLGLLTGLESVKLSNSLSFADVDRLQEANPHAVFDYSFQLFGKTISTADKEIVYKNQKIGNDGEEDLRKALSILEGCDRFVLDNCGFDSEVLAKVRDDFRDQVKVVWRVYFGTNGRYNTLTDDDTIRAVYNITDDTCGPMKYLEDVKYMDIGHNDKLSDLSFVSYMPELEVLIASESGVKELTGFDNCKKLTWLELAYCYKLENIDALAGCDGLKYLNLSYSKVKSLVPLDGLNLERFVYLSPKASTAEQNTFLSIHPKSECITVFYGYSMPYSYGWRYDDNGKTMFWYYKDVIREVFNYDQADAILKAQEDAK